VREMKRNVSVVCVCVFCCSILISGKIIKEMLGLVASGTPYIILSACNMEQTASQQHEAGG
jgi:hypothetical protein